MELWPTYYIILAILLMVAALWYLRMFTDTLIGRALRIASRTIQSQHHSAVSLPLIYLALLYTLLLVIVFIWLDVSRPISLWWSAPVFTFMFFGFVAAFIRRFPLWLYADFWAAVRLKDRLEADKAPYAPSSWTRFEARINAFEQWAPEPDWFTEDDVEAYRRRRDARRARRSH